MKKNYKYLASFMKFTIALIITFIGVNLYFAETVQNNTVIKDDLDTLKNLEPKDYYSYEDQLINTLLSRYHYNRYNLNDSLSSVILDRFLKSLDYRKEYFIRNDIESFEKYRFELDNDIKSGNVESFYKMFNIYLLRMRDRMSYQDTILKKEFDYSIDEKYLINRENAPWAESVDELNDLWRKKIKNDALNLKLNGKDWEAIKNNLEKRYRNYARLLEQFNSEDVFQIAMNSFTQSLDPHTNYLSPITSDNFKIDMSLSLEGIGARLQYDDGYTKIVEIIPGGPAFKSKKLHVNDRIVAVAQDEEDYVDVIGWRITDVVQLIRGPKDSIVKLKVISYDKKLTSEPVEIVLVRDKIKLEDQSAKSTTLDIISKGKPFKFGVITIPKFYIDFAGQQSGDKDFKSTSRDVKILIEKLEKENVDGVIIDLRNDGGGSLEEAVKVTGLFIKEGPVVQVRDMNGRIVVDKDDDPQITYDGPLAILINRFSASASEIFAGAMQNYGRAIIIGDNTYGKGTVQNLIDLNKISSTKDNKLGQLKLTIAKYYRIDGSSTQRVGVVPDIQFPSPIDPADFGESSEPSALKWDKIDPLVYKRYSDLSTLLPQLRKLSNQRIASNFEFDYIKEEIAEYKESLNDNFISLNEEVRRKEKEDREEKRFLRENERRKIKGLKLLTKGETPADDETENVDPYLDESTNILADLITLSIG